MRGEACDGVILHHSCAPLVITTCSKSFVDLATGDTFFGYEDFWKYRWKSKKIEERSLVVVGYGILQISLLCALLGRTSDKK